MKIAILGWGSLLWDDAANIEFNKHLEEPWNWKKDGPILKLEFSRISTSRNGALTLVIDRDHGSCCQVAYAISKRTKPDDAICDLRCREGTTLENIGFHFRDGSRKQRGDRKSLEKIKDWASDKQVDVVIWTNLKNSFENKSREQFYNSAIAHIQKLCPGCKEKAIEYIKLAPEFIKTKLRERLQAEPWFPK